MSLSKDRQGYLDDLDSMSLSQLKDLLERQEKILCKKKFLANLPDKGEKSQAFAEKLKKLIADGCEKELEEANRINFIKTTIQRSQDGSSFGENDIRNEEDDATIETLVTRNETDITYSSESNESEKYPVQEECRQMEINNSEDLSKKMQELSVGTGHPEMASTLANSYERVIKKAEADPSTIHTKFLPHRSKKEKSSISSTPCPTQIKSHLKEESAVCPPAYNHESTKLISIEESVHLLQDQKARTENLAAQRAAQRLADHFTPKMETYQPSGVDMSYRQTNVEDDTEQDSDDFPSDNDDGDDDAGL